MYLPNYLWFFLFLIIDFKKPSILFSEVLRKHCLNFSQKNLYNSNINNNYFANYIMSNIC